jgi:hypothetical protein
MEKPQLQRMTFEFVQEGNCVSDIPEILTIECESSLGIDNDEGCFYTLKTETGWTIDSVEELQVLIDRIKKVIEK